MKSLNVATPFLKECEDDTHTLEMGTWESSEILETLEFDCRGQKHLALRCSSCRWKALNESYKFASDLIPIQGLSKELWTHKVPGVQTGTVLGLLLGSLGTKSHSDVGAME